MPNQAPAHWSKDFVEHLRTVHLALIATASALIIVALTTKLYSTEVAKNELHRIQGLRANWSAEIATSLGLQEGKVMEHPGDFTLFESPRPDNFIAVPKKLCLDIFDKNEPKKTSLVEIGPYPTLVLASSPDGFRVLDGNFESRVPQMPQTVSGLQVWWDSIDASNFRLLRIDAIDGRVAVFPESRYTKLYTRYPAYIGRFHRLLNDCDVAVRPKYNVMRPEPELSMFKKDDWSELTVAFEAPYRNDDVGRTIQSLEFFASHYSYADLNRTTLSKYLGVSKDQFKHAFEDLRRVAEVNGVDTLDKLDEVLSRSEVSDTPAFEAFGIKFPADVATLGGTVVLLCVQLYFVLYLRRLGGTLRADDEGWNVPWIGMDSSAFGRGVYYATTVVLPIVSLFFLGGEASIRLSRGYWDFEEWPIHFLAPFWKWHWTAQLKILLLVVAIIFSAILGRLSWRYRPQIAPEPELPEYPDGLSKKWMR